MARPYARFEMLGTIDDAVVKTGKKSGKPYGKITVATGRAAHEFFVEPDEINAGKFKVGQAVKIAGQVGREGYNPTLTDFDIELVQAKQQSAA